MISSIQNLYYTVFNTINRLTEGWFLGFAARFLFLAVYFFYYKNSFFTKVGEGFTGFFQIQDGAYYQIVPQVMEAAGGDSSELSFLVHLVVFIGSYMEIILPILIILGLLTRMAALGMIGFTFIQTYVDIKYHGVEDETIGALFDRFPDSVISDQRLLLVFVLIVLTLQGGGYFSLDYLFYRKRLQTDDIVT